MRSEAETTSVVLFTPSLVDNSSLRYCCFVLSAAFVGDIKSSTELYFEEDGEDMLTNRFSFTL